MLRECSAAAESSSLCSSSRSRSWRSIPCSLPQAALTATLRSAEPAPAPSWRLGNLTPGDKASESVRIANTGSASGTFVPLGCSERNAKLASTLVLTVADDTGRIAYRGPLADLADETLGTFAPAEAHTYTLGVALPSTAGNELQGLSAGASFTWSAVSA